MHPNIRAATPADYESLLQIFREENGFHAQLVPEYIRAVPCVLDRDELAHMIDAHDQGLLVAELNGNLVAAALFSISAAEPERWVCPRSFVYIDDIAVRDEFRGRGIGRALMDAIARWAAEHGLGEIELHVWRRNQRAIDFYESLGFEVTRHTMRKCLRRPGARDSQ